jgi:hypothetical protein
MSEAGFPEGTENSTSFTSGREVNGRVSTGSVGRVPESSSTMCPVPAS